MYDGPERRQFAISDQDMEAIAERAAERALEKVYQEVGKAVLKKVAWMIGVCVVGALMFLAGKGYIPK